MSLLSKICNLFHVSGILVCPKCTETSNKFEYCIINKPTHIQFNCKCGNVSLWEVNMLNGYMLIYSFWDGVWRGRRSYRLKDIDNEKYI